MSEWNAPERVGEDWETESLDRLERVTLKRGTIEAWFDLSSEDRGPEPTPVSADAALRLLAAEASDRLGWKWTVDKGADGEPWYALCGSTHWYSMPGSDAYDFTQGLGGYGFDDAVAALHGKFLLETAMKAKL